VDQARRNLARARLGRVHVVCGDGGLGCREAAPYDRIIVTVGAWDIAPAWREQLRSGGRLVLLLSIRRPESQKSIAFDPVNDHLVSASVRDCGFMLLRGAAAGPVQLVPLGSEAGLHLVVDGPLPVAASTAYEWLMGTTQTWPTAVHVTPREAFSGLNLWLALREPRFRALVAQVAAADRELVPHLYGRASSPRSTVGLLDLGGLGLRARPPGYQLGNGGDEWSEQAPRFELEVRSFGPDVRLGGRLVELVRAWDSAGRAASEQLRLTAYPQEAQVHRPATGIVIEKRWTRLVMHWS
jgi:protein-L-isoaspartate(D-aspartate) O-methyltransferase